MNVDEHLQQSAKTDDFKSTFCILGKCKHIFVSSTITIENCPRGTLVSLFSLQLHIENESTPIVPYNNMCGFLGQAMRRLQIYFF